MTLRGGGGPAEYRNPPTKAPLYPLPAIVATVSAWLLQYHSGLQQPQSERRGIATDFYMGTQKFSPASSVASSRTAALDVTPTPAETDVSGGSITGITIGLLAVSALAGFSAFWWRKVRHNNSLFDGCPSHDVDGPIRTVITEKIESVVRTVPQAGVPYTADSIPVQTNYCAVTPVITTASNPIHSHAAIAVNLVNTVQHPPVSNNSH
ncbi:hypothetical protein BGZ80_005411 [Entomortierella chlamydospora]|uniref:Uncharacterized protein n=1 Tax=Entomortierella chlamydospora TaxID=101097 RepID=A0A9P6T2A8_9FUNG|nr:hypothetical protein BGZ79_002726 [Entomortierella chlamydospora]KAG0019683.1 hypothetical protein BGZ80_005411 [Entomortierella chlamydospora]